MLFRSVALCEDNTITPDDLRLSTKAPAADRQPASDPEGQADDSGTAEGDLDSYISNLERDAIMKALQETRYNKTAAAKKLGITFRAMRYKLKKLGID